MTIAHRLDTIIFSDRILAMASGQLKEFDTPTTLLQNSASFFTKLVGTWIGFVVDRFGRLVDSGGGGHKASGHACCGAWRRTCAYPVRLQRHASKNG